MPTQDALRHEQLHTLYADNHRWLYTWLCKKMGCVHRAEDMAQNTFLRLLSLQDLNVIREPRAFLVTTASRLIIDDVRRKQVEQQYLQAHAHYYGEDAAAPSPEALAVITETLVSITHMLDGLPEKCQQAFLMNRLDGMKHADIARVLGVSKSMIKQYIARAMVHCYQLVYED